MIPIGEAKKSSGRELAVTAGGAKNRYFVIVTNSAMGRNRRSPANHHRRVHFKRELGKNSMDETVCVACEGELYMHSMELPASHK